MKEAATIAIGIDGGGTSTRAAIVDENGLLIGEGESGASNYQAVGVDAAQQAIREAIERAWEQSEREREPALAIFLGMAGVVSRSDRAIIRQIALGIEPAAAVEVDHDLRPALAAGVGSAEGIVLVAGTGSACYGRTEDGRSWRSGGWGHLLDDCGSGYRLGLDGLVAVVRAADRRDPETLLSTTLPPAVGVTEMNEMLQTVHQRLSRADIAALAPLVLDAAGSGDRVAEAIIEHGADELSRMAHAVATALTWKAPPPPIVLSGSLFRSALYRKTVVARLEKKLHGSRTILPVGSAALAAAMLALGMKGRE